MTCSDMTCLHVVQRPPIPKKEYSQRDLLLEALETEVVNFKWLR